MSNKKIPAEQSRAASAALTGQARGDDSTQLAVGRWRRVSLPGSGKALRAGLLGCGVAVLLIAYLRGATANLYSVNVDAEKVDQRAYLEYARKLQLSNYSYVGGRNRMPVYPFLQAVLLGSEADPAIAFAGARKINLWLSVLLLASLWSVIRQALDRTGTASVIIICGFTVFMFKAGYVQSELLYYFLAATMFVSCLRYFRSGSPEGGIFVGIVSGLAYLTKASALPGLIVFVVLAVGYPTGRWLLRRATRDPRTGWGFRQEMGGILALGFFLLTVLPYVRNSRQAYGMWFYNVNSTFYMWHDSWAQAEADTKAHGDRLGWPAMPSEEIPLMQRYIREHAMGQLTGCVFDGLRQMARVARGSYGYAKYVLMNFIVLAAVAIARPRAYGRAIRDYVAVWLFALTYLGGYAILYAWYTPIESGNRLFLAGLLPILVGLQAALRVGLQGVSMRVRGREIDAYTLISACVVAVLASEIPVLVATRAPVLFGGE